MIELGKHNRLEFSRELEIGVYLDAEVYGEILLPRDQMPQGYQAGESLDVFLYCDSEERVIPTTKKPYGSVGTFSFLEVIDVTDAGAFLDWGLPKDLFVPRSEQKEIMEKGERYIVYIYKDERRTRLAASSRLDAFLGKEPVFFKVNDKVDLLISKLTDLGYKAIVDNSHWGLLYKDEVFQDLTVGQRVTGFIKKVREDERIDLSLHPLGYQKAEALEDQIIAKMKEKGGELSVTDKSSPQTIYELFGVSKKKYKMALGALYKAHSIILADDVIKIVESE